MPTVTVPQAFSLAFQHHQAGRLAEAEALYRQILAVEPNHPEALHYLGIIAHQTGRHDQAIDLIRRSTILAPGNAAAHSNLGEAFRARGRLDEALAANRRALQLQPDVPEMHNNLGLALAQRGQSDEAIAAYQRALALKPEFVEVHNNLGNALRDQGRIDEAVTSFRQALQLNPDYPEAHHNLGNALSERGNLDAAIASYRRALELRPNYPKAFNNLGTALCKQGRVAEGIAHYQRALQIQPDNAEALNNLGNAFSERGQFDEAIAHYQRSLQIRPGDALTRYHLGNAMKDRGRYDEAIAHYQRALQIQPDNAGAHNNLGMALAAQARFDEALGAYRQALHLRPNYPEALLNLGNALADQGQPGEAVVHYQRTLELKPESAEVHNGLGNALRDLGKIDEAVAAFRRALELTPEFPEIHNNLGMTLAARGQVDEAVAAYRRATELKPEFASARSNLLYALHFQSGCDHRTVVDEHHRWNCQFAEPLRQFHRSHANDRDPERRLRISYVSPDFNRHPICYFFTPLLEAHDKAQTQIFCYASIRRPDSLTERVKKTADVWCDGVGLGDAALAERIRADQIDILVDLTQHMANNRMLMFARKPAPIQVAWLGYPVTTGLAAMDYRFTDRLMEPEGSPWAESVETPIRLPDSWFCYDPIEYLEVSPPPALRNGHVTFGSLNNVGKMNEAVVRLWVAVLQAVDGSRLLLHCPEGAAQARLRPWFEAQGLPAHRLDLVTRTATRAEFLRLFDRVDIGLDPFPYNGGTTTCDALWMGVPVVSLQGQSAVSRLGRSALINAGLPEWVASSEDEYVGIASQLAHDLPKLAELRATLRTRMRSSPLMDAPRFARNIEAAYRTIWRQWCARES